MRKGLSLCVAIISSKVICIEAGELVLPTEPMTSASTVAPNVMMLFDTSESMNRLHIEGTNVTTRLAVAQKVARDLIDNTENTDFCLARFGSSASDFDGGRIIQECGASKEELKQSINELTAGDWTPLAESYYEVTRYFRGMSPYYHDYSHADYPNSKVVLTAGKYNSPISYRCQKNYVLVLTDGAPTADRPAIDHVKDRDLPSAGLLPNWDGISAPVGQPFSDGTHPEADRMLTENATYYLDDLAKFAWDIDAAPAGVRGQDEEGKSFDDSAFPVQNIHTYTVGFLEDNQMLEDAAAYGKGQYYTAENSTQLHAALTNVLHDISGKAFSASALGADSTQAQSDTRLFYAQYVGDKWQGKLFASNYDLENRRLSAPLWEASQKIPGWGQRNIFFSPDEAYPNRFAHAGNKPLKFRWASFKRAGRQQYFDREPEMLQFIRGRNNLGDSYRKRDSRLGDIVHSSPVYVGAPDGSIKVDRDLENSYKEFVSQKADRAAMVYVGANDGMLHGFYVGNRGAIEQNWNPSTGESIEVGEEVLGYIPSPMLNKLKTLADKDYQHQFFVDATPTTADVYFYDSGTSELSVGWKSILVGGLRSGGQGIYALNITSPELFLDEENASKIVIWELTDRNSPELGYTYGQPQIMRLNDNRWYAVFGNGYNSTEQDGKASESGDAVLFLVDIQTGSFEAISTEYGMDEDPSGSRTPNGLATPTGYDKDGDGLVDRIYAGDLLGNMWRFDVSQLSASNRNIAAEKMFTACAAQSCNTGYTPQPITSAPTVVRHGIQGVQVFFGTGKYLEVADKNPASVGLQSFYGLHEKTSTDVISSRSDLLEQTIETHQRLNSYGGDATNLSARYARTTSANLVESEHQGWFIDFKFEDNGVNVLEGEQVVSPSIMDGGGITFVTRRNTLEQKCAPPASYMLMQLNALNGSRFGFSNIDIDGDGDINDNDVVDTSEGKQGVSGIAVSGDSVTPLKSDEGFTDFGSAPGAGGGAGGNGSGGVDDKFTRTCGTSKRCSLQPGRNSWRSLRAL